MPADVGSQTVTLLYHTVANSLEWNKRFVGIRKTGLYSGGWLSIVNSTTAQIGTLICEITDGTHQVRISTASAVNLLVSSATPYIVLRWVYSGAATDYMQILAVATPATNDLIVGMCTFSGGGSLNGFSYTSRSNPSTKDLFLKVEPTGETELRVRIRGGYYQSATASVYVPDQKSNLFVLPASNSKVYLVYVDTDGLVKIDSSGAAAALPTAPSYLGKLVLAEVTLASTDTSITVSKIKDVRPFISSGGRGVDGTTITINANGQLKTVDPYYLVRQSDVVQADTKATWTKLTYDNQIKTSGISESSGVITLAAGRLYRISYTAMFERISVSVLFEAYSRVRVLSGDVSWEFKDDDNNVSLQKALNYPVFLLTHTVGNRATLSGSYIIIPSSTTTLQLEVKTSGAYGNSKVIGCSITIEG